MTGLDQLPLRDDLRGRSPYGAPQLDVPVRLNTNENSWPLPQGLLDDVTAAAATVAARLNRYPDRDALALRADLAAYLGPRAARPAQVWAANGSNEIIQQLLQAFGGPGRTALGFTPSYSMHEIITTGTGTRWLPGVRDAEFGISPQDAVAQVREHAPDVVFLTSPNNPTGTALPLATVEAVLAEAPGMVVVDEAYAEFARAGVPSRADPAARPAAAGGDPDDVQGVRDGRAAARLPGRGPGGGRRGAAGAAAVPPLRADPGRRPGRAGARAASCWPAWPRSRPSGTGSSRRCRRTG